MAKKKNLEPSEPLIEFRGVVHPASEPPKQEGYYICECKTPSVFCCIMYWDGVGWETNTNVLRWTELPF